MGTSERLRIIGLHFLSELFVSCKHDTSRGINMYEIGRKCGCSWNETKQITEELSDLDLLQKNKPNFDKVSITPKGIALIKGERTVKYNIPVF